MAEERIKRKNLYLGLGKVTQSDWCKCAERLGLIASVSGGRGSHAVIRDPKYPEPSDYRGLIATIQKDLQKQYNQTIFKHFLDFGILEDDIWKALKML